MIRKTEIVRKIFPTADALQNWAANFSHELLPGDVVILMGNLGAGKTTFTQGLASGLGITDPISSPTFTLSRIYPATTEHCGLVHIDVYRLLDHAPQKDDVVAFQGYFGLHIDSLDVEEYLQDCIIAIEWGGDLAQIFTDHWWEITISLQDNILDGDGREVLVQKVIECQ